GTVVSSVLSERIIRRFGTGVVTMTSVLMTAAALTGFSFSGSFFSLCLFAIPLGLGAGSVDAALNNYVALHYKARHMSWLHCFWGIGASIGPVIMSLHLVNASSWNSGYRTIGIIQFCLVFILIVSLPLWGKNKMQETSAKSEPVNYKKLFSIAGIKEALVAFFCYCSLETVAGLWGASYLVTIRNFSPEIAAQWVSLYYIGITAGRFVSGFITMKMNNRQMVRMGQIIIACGIIVLALPFEYCALAGLFLIGLGCAPIYPSLLHETPINFGREFSQAAIGIQMGCAYVGTAIMPPIFGWIASHLSFSVFPAFLGMILIVKIILVEILNRKVDNRLIKGGN
ncbi:MAG: MFS transporter, partial [Treponema sp.]|nr:MFS transporter [Treponema sp.]MCL2238224.1 MFS transporter [Treponema sp.]